MNGKDRARFASRARPSVVQSVVTTQMSFFKRLLGAAQEHDPHPLEQQVVIQTEAGAMTDPGNFALELIQLEGHISKVLLEEGLGVYRGSRTHRFGIELEMRGPDGEQIVGRMKRLLRPYAPFYCHARFVIRGGGPRHLIKEGNLEDFSVTQEPKERHSNAKCERCNQTITIEEKLYMFRQQIVCGKCWKLLAASELAVGRAVRP